MTRKPRGMHSSSKVCSHQRGSVMKWSQENNQNHYGLIKELLINKVIEQVPFHTLHMKIRLWSFSYACVSACFHRVCSGSFWGGLPAAVWMWKRSVWQTDRTLQLQRRLDWRALWERWVGEELLPSWERCGNYADVMVIRCIFVNRNF